MGVVLGLQRLPHPPSWSPVGTHWSLISLSLSVLIFLQKEGGSRRARTALARGPHPKSPPCQLLPSILRLPSCQQGRASPPRQLWGLCDMEENPRTVCAE